MGRTIFTEGMPLGGLLINGFGVTLLGMGVVFLVLVIISFSLDLLRIFFAGGKRPELSPEPAAPRPVLPMRSEEMKDDAELIAVIAAAVAAFTDIPVEGLRIRSVRPADAQDPVWSRVGRRLQMGQRL
jgi:glutaconyl-CoA/methylmalonyl-CoA decarboxylase subunit delta